MKIGWKDIIVSSHAIQRYCQRISEGPYCSQNKALRRLKYTLMEGRCSLTDKLLLFEIEPYLERAHKTNNGRPVVFFMDKHGLVALTVRGGDDKWVVLTCFKITN